MGGGKEVVRERRDRERRGWGGYGADRQTSVMS